MCAIKTRLAIEDLVRQRIAEHAQFTAYDITCALRGQERRWRRVLHRDVREVVHQMFSFGQMGLAYERTLLDVGGERGPAFVYHPFLDDPRNYLNTHRHAWIGLPAAPPISCTPGASETMMIRIS